MATAGQSSQAESKGESHKPSGLTAVFGEEIEQLKKTAIGATMELVHQVVTDAVPEPVRPDLGKIIERVTIKLGGEPASGPVFETRA